MEQKDKAYVKRANVLNKYERVQKPSDQSNLKIQRVNITVTKDTEIPSYVGQVKEKYIKNIFIRKLGIERYHLK